MAAALLLSDKEIKSIFSNVEAIRMTNAMLHSKLEIARASGALPGRIVCQGFRDLAPYMKARPAC